MHAIIYSKDHCPYCDKAKRLLEQQNIKYTQYMLDIGQLKEDDQVYYTRDELLKVVPNARSVPQIFIDDNYIGGYTQLEQHLNK
ncbi:MAG: glutaredoxin domain-containing protein [Candidatus Nitrosotenuis sp.]